MVCYAERPKLSDPAHGARRVQSRRFCRVRCSTWLALLFVRCRKRLQNLHRENLVDLAVAWHWLRSSGFGW